MEEVEEKVTFMQAQVEAMKSLRKAFKMDAERGKLIKDTKEQDPTPNKYVRAWMKSNWMNLIVWVVAVGIAWSVITPKQIRKRSHHKYDENGRLIY